MLTADIDLTDNGQPRHWQPIGGIFDNVERYYSGTFDGNRYSVKGYTVPPDNMAYYENSGTKAEANGFFGVISANATVKSLTLRSDVKIENYRNIDATLTCIGGVTGLNVDGTIIGCTYSGTISFSGDYYSAVGGIVGRNDGGKIRDCAYSDGDIFSEAKQYANPYIAYAGGIAGENNGEIISCVNCSNDDVSTNSSMGGNYAGGIVGYNKSRIINCIYSGAGNIHGKYSGGGAHAGGIAGGNSSNGEITNCVNSGTAEIYVEGGYSNAGGIVGINNGKLTSCVYSGNGKVLTRNDNNGRSSAGGIAGNHYGNDGTITNCGWNKDAASVGIGNGDVDNVTGVGSCDAEEFAKIVTIVILDDTEVAAGASTEVKFTTFPGKPDNLADYITVTSADTDDQSVATTSFGNGNITVKGLKEGITELLASVEINAYDFENGKISDSVSTSADLSSMVTVSSAPPTPETPTDPDTPTDPETPPTPDTHKPRSGGSSGCDTGTAAIALLALLPLFYKKKR